MANSQDKHFFHFREAFIANRSISVNPSCTGTITKTSSPFANWRSVQQQPAINRSHDDLSRLGGGESLDEESLMGGAADSYTVSSFREKENSISMFYITE
jgi:hypothetical protein